MRPTQRCEPKCKIDPGATMRNPGTKCFRPSPLVTCAASAATPPLSQKMSSSKLGLSPSDRIRVQQDQVHSRSTRDADSKSIKSPSVHTTSPYNRLPFLNSTATKDEQKTPTVTPGTSPSKNIGSPTPKRSGLSGAPSHIHNSSSSVKKGGSSKTEIYAANLFAQPTTTKAVVAAVDSCQSNPVRVVPESSVKASTNPSSQAVSTITERSKSPRDIVEETQRAIMLALKSLSSLDQKRAFFAMLDKIMLLGQGDDDDAGSLSSALLDLSQQILNASMKTSNVKSQHTGKTALISEKKKEHVVILENILPCGNTSQESPQATPPRQMHHKLLANRFAAFYDEFGNPSPLRVFPQLNQSELSMDECDETPSFAPVELQEPSQHVRIHLQEENLRIKRAASAPNSAPALSKSWRSSLIDIHDQEDRSFEEARFDPDITVIADASVGCESSASETDDDDDGAQRLSIYLGRHLGSLGVQLSGRVVNGIDCGIFVSSISDNSRGNGALLQKDDQIVEVPFLHDANPRIFTNFSSLSL